MVPARGLLALAAMLLAGCYTMPGGPSRRGGGPQQQAMPPPELSPSGPTPGGAFDARLVDPRFEQAFADYWRDLRTLRWDSNDNEVRRSMRLLAITAEHVPYTGSVDVAGSAARVRGGRSERTTFAGPMVGAPAPPVAAGDPMQQLAKTFVELAKGPYKDGVGVLAAAYGFDHAVGAMLAARARGGDRLASFEALRAAENLFFAIRGALGRGEVGLVSNAPPPVDFGQ